MKPKKLHNLLMNRYLFQLGKHPYLSHFELQRVFDASEIISLGPEIAVIHTKREIDQSFLDTLGGTIKIARIVSLSALEYLSDLFSESDGKHAFAMSLFGSPEFKLKRYLMDTKKALKQQGYSVRFINKQFMNVQSVQVEKERLVSEKSDLMLFEQNSKLTVAYTVALQDFEGYSFRDYEKPFRDARMGMLPPKLAQMMLNIALGQGTKATVYDPFCGSGTILIEAMLRGFDCIGSDIDPKAVEGTKQNLEWVQKETNNTKVTFNVFVHDAGRTLEIKSLTGSNLIIVSEGFLGPPQKVLPSEAEIKSVFTQIDMIYQNFFKNMAERLPKGATICMTFPFFQSKSPIFFPYVQAYCSHGYRIVSPVRQLLYARKDQIVGREAVLLEKV
jgi:tRNA G10  N-methylase Trm11